MKRHLIKIVLLFICFQWSAFGQVRQAIPRAKDDALVRIMKTLEGYVADYENIFTQQEIFYLDSFATDFEQRTSIEIAIVTMNEIHVDISDFDSYSLTLANAWRIGKADKNNGILIAISSEFRKIRVQNGLGIERLLSDEETKQIIDDFFVPYLKNKQYFEGVKMGLMALTSTLQQKLK